MNEPKTLETRHCFKPEKHTQHEWHDKYWCEGQGIDPETKKVRESPTRNLRIVEEAPEILDARTAYGDRVTNMADQAAMINAYLGGREVTAIDVPMIFILVKVQRLGNMPDYKDNYDDIEGYLQIAKEIIGDDMIDAKTAREYAEIKAEPKGVCGETIPVLGATDTCILPKGHKGLHRYALVINDPERAAETDAMKSWAKKTGNPYANVDDSL